MQTEEGGSVAWRMRGQMFRVESSKDVGATSPIEIFRPWRAERPDSTTSVKILRNPAYLPVAFTAALRGFVETCQQGLQPFVPSVVIAVRLAQLRLCLVQSWATDLDIPMLYGFAAAVFAKLVANACRIGNPRWSTIMKIRPSFAIGAALTAIVATVALAEKLSVTEAPVPVPFLARFESRGDFIRCTARNAIAVGVLAYARTQLEITPDEEPAWNRFTDAFQQALKPIDLLCDESEANASPPNTLSALMERKERSTEITLQVLKSVRTAVSELESSLTSDQKRRLIELVPLPRK